MDGALARAGRERETERQAARFDAGTAGNDRQGGAMPRHRGLGGETEERETPVDGRLPGAGPALAESRQQRRERKALQRLKGAA